MLLRPLAMRSSHLIWLLLVVALFWSQQCCPARCAPSFRGALEQRWEGQSMGSIVEALPSVVRCEGRIVYALFDRMALPTDGLLSIHRMPTRAVRVLDTMHQQSYAYRTLSILRSRHHPPMFL